jgi:hypothetical protein
LVLYFLIQTKELFSGYYINPKILNDDAKHPSLIDHCQFYEYDLQRLKPKYEECPASVKYKAPTIDESPRAYSCTEYTDPLHYKSTHAVVEGFHGEKCTDEKCFCD